VEQWLGVRLMLSNERIMRDSRPEPIEQSVNASTVEEHSPCNRRGSIHHMPVFSN